MSEQRDPYREPGILAVVAGVAAVLCLFVPALTRDGTHAGRLVLTLVAGAFLGAHLWLLREPIASRSRLIWRAALVAVCVVGIGNYFQFDRRVFTGITDYTDVDYYYLNSKYFEELGYTGLYPALVWADRQRGEHKTDHIEQVRDLSDYRLRPVEIAVREGRRLEADAFTPERWEAFGDDADMLLNQLSPAALKDNFFVDHGYNPPPTWTLIGGALSELTPVLYVPTLTHVDTVIVAATFGCVLWAFGIDATLLALLWFLVTFSGRWPILGQSILRFDWLCAVVAATCFVKRDRMLPAGALLAYAALTRVFPVIFLAPLVVALAWDTWKQRELPERWRTFLVGAVALSVVLLTASFVRFGAPAYQASIHNLWMHNQSYSSHRVGLGDVLVYRGETTREQVNDNGGIRAKEKQVASLQTPLRVVGLGAMVLVAVAVVRSGREDWEAIGWAALPLFCVTNAQINYWNLRWVLVLWHLWLLRSGGRPDDRKFAALGLAWLFAAEAATQYSHISGFDRYITTTTTSLFLLVYFALLAGWLGWSSRKLRE